MVGAASSARPRSLALPYPVCSGDNPTPSEGAFAWTDRGAGWGWGWQFPAFQTRALVTATSWLPPLSATAPGAARWRSAKGKPRLPACKSLPCTGRFPLETGVVLRGEQRVPVHGREQGDTGVPGEGPCTG